MYDILRPALFAFSPETSHDLSLESLAAAHRLGLSRWFPKVPSCDPVQQWGLEFANPIGLAAGLDKNADYLDALGALGFGFVEVGTVTPRPQQGNPKPRLFRLQNSQAIINRMGFNNKGVDHLVTQVRKSQYPGVIGINIGKNKDTPEDRALDDYVYCLDRVYRYAGYVVVNLSSPNTPGLRNLQFGDALKTLLAGLQQRQQQLADQYGFKPILIKIAPDLNESEIDAISAVFNEFEVDGVVATNTTLARDAVSGERFAGEAGGLSGQPLFHASTEVLRAFRRYLKPTIPLIGVGGVLYGDDARVKKDAGADLVQIYSGFIYRGPRLIQECIEAWQD
ncbi:quinone-dependent dihydroorotate dehydrogenase [Saccharospirillum mangrovi]|uniref:quinone-dependent dihydroorotate dehydrogenase n=1 Tax=Saccharospirillum mangrovi TaxID=2161747 RepID=UPI000D3C0EF1|nr:quinone-dependent dihydroorotate dehydrogenase [Saccharospirillum mangrovi]